MNKCLKHLFNSLTQNFKTGIPDLQIKPLDPVLFEKVPLNISGVFDIKGNYYNATLTGLAGVHFTEAKSDLKKYRIDLKVNFKSFEIKGISDTNGRLLFLAYRNYGDFLIFGSECIRRHIMWHSLSLLSILDGVTSLVKLRFKPVQKNGQVYLLLTTSSLDFTLKSFSIQSKDYNSQVLGEAITQVLNNNSMEFFKSLKPVMVKIMGSAIEDYLRKLFLSVPENQIFP